MPLTWRDHNIDECLRVLDLSPDASASDVRRAWRDLTRVWHPDRFPEDGRLQARAEQKFKAINAAYSRIRAVHRERLRHPQAVAASAASPAPPLRLGDGRAVPLAHEGAADQGYAALLAALVLCGLAVVTWEQEEAAARAVLACVAGLAVLARALARSVVRRGRVRLTLAAAPPLLALAFLGADPGLGHLRAERGYRLGLALLEEGRADAAEPHLRRAQAGGLDDARTRRALAAALLAQGREVEAAPLLARGRSAAEDLALAELLARARQPERALDHVRAALALDPGNAATHRLLGTLYDDVGQFEDAVAAYRTALSLQPDSGETERALGFAYVNRAERLRAERLRQHLAFAGGQAPLSRTRATRAAAGTDPQPVAAEAFDPRLLARLALPLFSRAVAREPHEPWGQFGLGLALMLDDRLDEACLPLREALRLRPAWGRAHEALGTALVRRAERGDAAPHLLDSGLEHLQQAVRRQPGTTAYAVLLTALVQAGRVEEAAELLAQGRKSGLLPEALPAGGDTWP